MALRVAGNMYKIDKKLGQGSFGVVYHLQISNGSEFAVKVSQDGRLNGHETDPATEASLMLKLNHVHLVQCCASFSHGRHVYLVMELCSHGTLKHFLSTRTRPVREPQVLAWLGQMADALRYLHICRVIHRDLKTENVFLDDRRHVKIGDLGISREMDFTEQRADTFTGTFCYMSPEVLQNSTYSYKTDIWSLGCCVHEVLTLQQTFAAQSMMEVLHKIMEADIPQIPNIYSTGLQNLILRLLDRKARRRPDGLEILYAVSQIQGFPFESVPYQPLENVQINQKLLYEAVCEFEQKYLDHGEPQLNKIKSTVTTAKEKRSGNTNTTEDTDSDMQSSILPKQRLKTKTKQPRPLPPCRHVTKGAPVATERESLANNTIDEQRNNLPKQKQPSEQNNLSELTASVQSVPTLSPQGSPPSSHSSSGLNKVVSNNFSLSSVDQLSNTRASQEETVLSAQPDLGYGAGDTGVNISKYMDHLATESRKWLRLRFGLPEENRRNLEGEVIDCEAEADDLVTLYTRAQVARYNVRKGQLDKDVT